MFEWDLLQLCNTHKYMIMLSAALIVGTNFAIIVPVWFFVQLLCIAVF